MRTEFYFRIILKEPPVIDVSFTLSVIETRKPESDVLLLFPSHHPVFFLYLIHHRRIGKLSILY